MRLMRFGLRRRGFTVVELMVTVAVAALLSALAVPAFRTWIANGKVRATAEQVMAQVRLAQAEAVKRYRRVVLYRANSTSCTTAPAASATGNVWVIATLPLYTGDTTEIVQCGNLVDTANDMTFTTTSPTAVCFGTNGWPIALPSGTGVGTTGLSVACAAGAQAFGLTKTGADRTLQVTLAVAGTVRMCDASKTFSSSNPDGC